MRFISDIDHWGIKDYWATPVEFLATDAGDCEDYVIAKYFTLKALGVAESKLYLTYVKAVKLNQAHMVLTYFENPKSIPLVLDNLNSKIFPATQRKDLLPVYSFNGDGLWLAKERGKGQSVSSGTSKLTQWNNLLKKLETSQP
ncbi:transglutaminase-like cysteine peptidase [Thiomicrorhabdus aquaedulcis]|uniref:transglutaminase-like cysteine peptidase n=1 Tax=Thiomicrorhabdus aquaedulcis TaxID=2211106 RepID=UPI001E3F7B58|nr:transglutaminase-like cysteine peptidase [Thiomicrorhabdus aquaedulcis]